MKLSFICCFVIVQLVFTVNNGVASCYGGGVADKKMERKVLARLHRLPEVSGFLKLNKRDKPMLVIEREPDSAFKYYWVSVGVSNLGMYRTTTHFYINPKTFQIYYIDFMDWTGSGLVPLRQWRRLRKDSRFYSLHKIKAGKLIPTKEII